MTKIIIFLIAISCFSLGFIVSEYRHNKEVLALPDRGIDLQKLEPSILPGLNNSVIAETSVAANIQPHEFSWQHINQLISDARYEDAIHLLKKQLELNPNSSPAWHLLAQAYERRGDHQAALIAWFHYLDYESDILKRDLAHNSIKAYLMRLYETPSLIKDDSFWLIAQLDKLLGLTNDGEVHVTLASLYIQTDDNYQAQYHALMAVNDPKVQQRAEDILAQLNGASVPDSLTIPLIRFGNQYLVQVNIEGYPARLLLDTGASLSGVSNTYAAKYPGIVKQTKPIRLNTAAGIADTYLFTVDYFNVGTLAFNQHILALLPMHTMTDFDGLLGVDILGRFDFVIDQDALVLRLRARKN